MVDLDKVLPDGVPIETRNELEVCLTQLFSVLIRIFLPGMANGPEPRPKIETYGLNPLAQYNDSDFQQMLGVTEKTTYRWRKENRIAYFKGEGGKYGGKIWYTGQAIIDFYRTYRVAKRLKPLKPIWKDVPQGHI
ncbi:MAG: helix-turn-helix domain-containing protein [Muribaculum sp.]|nr:helix-turn-helix domain-containing protein [Muribaculum sp.]